MTRRILVTPRSLTRDGDPALERLRQAGSEVVTCTPGGYEFLSTPWVRRLLGMGCVTSSE